jgi:hypothetical protein
MQQQDSRTGPETAQKNTRFLHLHVKSSKILERRGVCHRAFRFHYFAKVANIPFCS